MLEFGFYNMDCMDGMAEFPDKFFDLAIADPPYFSGPERREYYGSKVSSIGVSRGYAKAGRWKVPEEPYFCELERVSKHQIVFGVNYFPFHKFPVGRIVWDKCNGSSSYSDGEIAATDLFDSVRLYQYMWNGMMQGKSMSEGCVAQGNKVMNEKRIHQTQKPVNLYLWILTTKAQPGWKIIDPNVGSASSLIACHKTGNPVVGFEIDSDIFKRAKNRMDIYRSQGTIFDFMEA